MSRAAVMIRNDSDREHAARLAWKMPNGGSVEFRQARRSLSQNSKLWAMVTEVSEQVDWYGQKLIAEDWKDIFTASLRQARVVPGIDAGTFVVLGLHTSTMTKDELAQLLELIACFGAEHGVVFHDGQAPFSREKVAS
jgi:hypothetical protein